MTDRVFCFWDKNVMCDCLHDRSALASVMGDSWTSSSRILNLGIDSPLLPGFQYLLLFQ